MSYLAILLRLKIGSFLISAASWVLDLGVKVFPTAEVEQAVKSMRGSEVYITDVLHGPFLLSEMPEEDIPEGVYYDDTTALIECRLLIGDELTIQPVYTTFDHAYELQKHFRSSIEPVRIDWG